jgi:hypothetical protein
MQVSPNFFISLQRYTEIGKQLLISNDRNRVRWVVLGLAHYGACTDFLENLSMSSLQGDLSNATTFNPPLFLLVNTFKGFTLNLEKKFTKIPYFFKVNLNPLKLSILKILFVW